jgi:hypothetical protein
VKWGMNSYIPIPINNIYLYTREVPIYERDIPRNERDIPRNERGTDRREVEHMVTKAVRRRQHGADALSQSVSRSLSKAV